MCQDTAKSLIEDDTYYTMSLLKKGACHAYSPRSVSCCICGCSFSKDSSATGVRVFNCGHATHLQCEFQENEGSNRDYSAGCPICMPKKKTSRARGKTIILENGLVKNSLSRTQQAQGISTVLNIHESDVAELPYGLHQMSRVSKRFGYLLKSYRGAGRYISNLDCRVDNKSLKGRRCPKNLPDLKIVVLKFIFLFCCLDLARRFLGHPVSKDAPIRSMDCIIKTDLHPNKTMHLAVIYVS